MKQIAVIAALVWVLFFNGADSIKQLFKGSLLDNQPIAGVSIESVSTEIPTQIATDTPLPTATATEIPLPTATATEVVVIPATIAEPTATATVTPLPTFVVIYPSANQQWAVHEIDERGYKQDCVYIYTLGKRVCWAPGIHPSESDIRWVVGATEAGYIKGEEIPPGDYK